MRRHRAATCSFFSIDLFVEAAPDETTVSQPFLSDPVRHRFDDGCLSGTLTDPIRRSEPDASCAQLTDAELGQGPDSSNYSLIRFGIFLRDRKPFDAMFDDHPHRWRNDLVSGANVRCQTNQVPKES